MGVYLVTGGAGFIGSNFIKLLYESEEGATVINIDKLTYAGDISRNETVSRNRSYTFIRQDICDKEDIKRIFNRYKPDYIINFAAETHVDRSISGSEVFIRSNVLGTHTLLQASLEHGVKCFIQVSTDEVYGPADVDANLTESAALAPGNPYSASKASGDMIALSYCNTYGLPVIVTRSSNNFGSGQNSEKLIPMVIGRCLRNEEIPIYGNGLQIRDWVHVNDNCRAIYSVLEHGVKGEIYNISAYNKICNINLVKQIMHMLRDMLPKDDLRKKKINEDLISFVEDRKGHDGCYSISSEKIRSQLGWRPEHEFNGALEQTVWSYINSIGK